VQPLAIDPDCIPTTFNIFMIVTVAAAGGLTIRPPLSTPGDFVSLRAEMDLID
jgi:uncharacterized protein YcgI (DUF1989 family)